MYTSKICFRWAFLFPAVGGFKKIGSFQIQINFFILCNKILDSTIQKTKDVESHIMNRFILKFDYFYDILVPL